VTNREKAEEFARLLDYMPRLLTVCVSKKCSLAKHVREQFPATITLAWDPKQVSNLVINDRGLSGVMTFAGESEFVFVPWCAIMFVYPPGGEREVSESTVTIPPDASTPALPRRSSIPQGWAVIKGGR
jgi:Stringent starvation protein B